MIENFIEHSKTLTSLQKQIVTVCMILMGLSGALLMKLMQALDDVEKDREITYDEIEVD
mgnify:CR=1 FL=1